MTFLFSWWWVRSGCLSLLRLVFLWPALISGAAMLVMALLYAQGGVTAQVAEYARESARWQSAPTGHLMVPDCPGTGGMPVAPLSQEEWRAQTETLSACPVRAVPFEAAAEDDMRRLRGLAVAVLLVSLCLEMVRVLFFRRAGYAVSAGEGRGARMPWPVKPGKEEK